jgi:uncharacterized protein
VRLAATTHAVLGGTPAYRELLRGRRPGSVGGFGEWVCRAVLDPASPLQREARYLFGEDMPGVREPSLYHSILAGIAAGHTRRGDIASYLGRATTDLAHPLQVLEDVGYLRKAEDTFNRRNPAWQIRDPILSFYYAVMRPVWPQLERADGVAAAWQRQQSTFASQVLGPHFEQMCRDWAFRYAAASSFGADQTHGVGRGAISHGREDRFEIDVVVHGLCGGARCLVSIGEAKWGQRMGIGHLARLRRARDLLAAKGVDVSRTRLACYSGLGFAAPLRRAEADGEVVLVDLERLYGGS